MMSAFPIDESVCGQCRVSTYDLLTTTRLLIRSDGGGRLRTVDRKGFALLEFFREKYHHALKMTLTVSVDVSLLLLQLPLKSTDRYIQIREHLLTYIAYYTDMYKIFCTRHLYSTCHICWGTTDFR